MFLSNCATGSSSSHMWPVVTTLTKTQASILKRSKYHNSGNNRTINNNANIANSNNASYKGLVIRVSYWSVMILPACGRGWLYSWLTAVMVDCGHASRWAWLTVAMINCSHGWLWPWLTVVSVDCGYGWLWARFTVGMVDYGSGWLLPIVGCGRGLVWLIVSYAYAWQWPCLKVAMVECGNCWLWSWLTVVVVACNHCGCNKQCIL